MSLLERFFSEQHLEAIAAMLFHSVWQGAVMASVAGAILLITKRSAATLRYNLLLTLLLLFAMGAVCTYWSYLPGDEPSLSAAPEVTVLSIDDSNGESPMQGIMHWLHAHASFIVFIWLLVMIFRLAFIMTGYFRVQRLAEKHLVLPSREWQRRWRQLTEEMRIAVPVRLMESLVAKVPMVIGHFRPLVLVPAGMLMSLPPQEAEAILLHELAHIRRRDYLINLLQQAVECIFFFHPAVLWVGSLISEEREHCCDDMASKRNGDKRAYINALVSFYEKALPPATALSFRGKKYHLLGRIKRLINQRNKTLNIMEKIFLTVGLVIACFLVHAYANVNTSVSQNSKHYIMDTVPKAKREMQKAAERNQEEQQRQQQDTEQMRREIENAKQDAEEALEEAKAELEKKRAIRKNNDEKEINTDEIEKAISEAMREAEKAIQKLHEKGVSKEINKEVQKALSEARRELQEVRININDENINNEVQADVNLELSNLSKEVTALALEAAQLGLEKANLELSLSHDNGNGNNNVNRSGKMDRKEYRERKKQLREEYRNSQRNTD